MCPVCETSRRIVISGVGLVSPLGHSAPQTFRALLAGRTIGERVKSLGSNPDPVTLAAAAGGVSMAKHCATDPAVDLAEWAAREALGDAGLTSDGLDCVIGASKGAVQALTTAWAKHTNPHALRKLTLGPVPSPVPRDCELAVALGPHGYLAHHLRRRMRLGQVTNVVAACASALAAVHKARTILLNHNHLSGRRSILVVTSEAALLPAFIASYHRLGVLSPLTVQGFAGRPLDGHRCGFMLCEVGAAVVLEVTEQPSPGQIELCNTAVATDGYDLIRTSPSMESVGQIAARFLSNGPIDVLHPHATGTIDHDPCELAAFARNMGPKHSVQATDVYAVKGAIGHGLGSGGLVSLVVAVLCALFNRRPPMPWLNDPIQTPFRLHPAEVSLKPYARHAVFSAGFGGHAAGALICRAPNMG